MTGLRRKRSPVYREGYLKSPAWRKRRREFLETLGPLRCRCLGEPLTMVDAVVHHVSYDGVIRTDAGEWIARERDEDLMVLCQWCHERIHEAMDRDPGWSSRNRHAATIAIIRKIQHRVLIAAVRLDEESRTR